MWGDPHLKIVFMRRTGRHTHTARDALTGCRQSSHAKGAASDCCGSMEVYRIREWLTDEQASLGPPGNNMHRPGHPSCGALVCSSPLRCVWQAPVRAFDA